MKIDTLFLLMQRFAYRANIIVWTLLVFLLGHISGVFGFVAHQVSAPSAVMTLVEDRHNPVATVYLREILQDSITGTIGSGSRLVIGNHLVNEGEVGEFSIPARDFLVRVIDVSVPHGAQFVASRKGKRYYPVDSLAGTKLVPENRIYFRSSEEAEKMGYTSS